MEIVKKEVYLFLIETGENRFIIKLFKHNDIEAVKRYKEKIKKKI